MKKNISSVIHFAHLYYLSLLFLLLLLKFIRSWFTIVTFCMRVCIVCRQLSVHCIAISNYENIFSSKRNQKIKKLTSFMFAFETDDNSTLTK